MEDNLNNLVKLLKENHLTICSAESLSGGLFASSLTSISGASSFFKGGLVTYMNEAKVRLLGISYEDIDKYGVVSKEIALQMANNAKQITKSDISVSFTGNAGPTSLENKPVGLVFIGICIFNEAFVYEFKFNGDRDSIRNQCLETAYNLITEIIKSKFSNLDNK